MKKFATGLLAGVILTSSITTFAAGGKMIEVFENVKKVVVDNSYKPFNSNTKPFVYNGTTYVPLRFVADALGESVSWDGKTGTIYIGGDSSQQNNPYIDILGTWEGSMQWTTGRQDVIIDIYQDNNGDLKGKCEIYPSADNLQSGKRGSVLMNVEYSPHNGVMSLVGEKGLSGYFANDNVHIKSEYNVVVSDGVAVGRRMDIFYTSKVELKKIK